MRLSRMTFPATRPCLQLIRKRRLSMKHYHVARTGLQFKHLMSPLLKWGKGDSIT